MIDKDWDEFTDWAAEEAWMPAPPSKDYDGERRYADIRYIYFCLLVMARNPVPDVIIQYLEAADLAPQT